MQNVSERLYKPKSLHVDLQSGEQMQQLFPECFLVLEGFQHVPLNQDVERRSKERMCALYSQVLKCWQLSRSVT